MNIDEKLRANRARFTRKLEDVRADNDLSREGKARRLAPLYQEAKTLDAKLRSERMEGLREKVRDTEREAFKAPALRNADPAAMQMNYRHALDAVDGITDARILSSRLERAVITGDKPLARAVAWRANELQHDGVVNAYLDSDSDARRKWTAWAEAHTEAERVEQLGETLGFGDVPISEPPELRGYVQEAS
jgi:hypothetical protein